MSMDKLVVQGWQCPLCNSIYSPFILSCNCAKKAASATWKFWPGWSGNHDRRIDDAVCTNCNYKHETVFGSIDKLAKRCPGCGFKMFE